MKKEIAYISLMLISVCLPAVTRAQYVKRENITGVDNAVVLYSAGIHQAALWELGRVFSDNRKEANATIRHTESSGNGDNLNVNAKLPSRILIAPNDVHMTATSTWAEAMGFSPEDNNNNESLPKGVNISGCSGYSSGTNFQGYTGLVGWRLPTQREMLLMWVFRDEIDKALLKGYSFRDPLRGVYWTSTENTAGTAWYVNFDDLTGSDASFQSYICNTTAKTEKHKVRCVKDI